MNNSSGDPPPPYHALQGVLLLLSCAVAGVLTDHSCQGLHPIMMDTTFRSHHKPIKVNISTYNKSFMCKSIEVSKTAPKRVRVLDITYFRTIRIKMGTKMTTKMLMGKRQLMTLSRR